MSTPYLDPCVWNPFGPDGLPGFASSGEPPPFTPPEWLITRTITKLAVIGCVVVTIAGTAFLVSRLRTGPGPTPRDPWVPGPDPVPTPPITAQADADGGTANSNPVGNGVPANVPRLP